MIERDHIRAAFKPNLRKLSANQQVAGLSLDRPGC
jgi:hypothetical protein